MRVMETRITGPEGMQIEAREFLLKLTPHSDRATVVALSGDLGAGKTTFVKGIAHELGLETHVTSPTFVIMKIYDLEGQKFERLIHIDAYRLKGMHHLKVLGWDALLNNPHNLIFIEWPEMIAPAIPEDAIRIALSYSEDTARTITYG